MCNVKRYLCTKTLYGDLTVSDGKVYAGITDSTGLWIFDEWWLKSSVKVEDFNVTRHGSLVYSENIDNFVEVY